MLKLNVKRGWRNSRSKGRVDRRRGIRGDGGIDIDIEGGMRMKRDRDINIDIIEGMTSIEHDRAVLIHEESGSLIGRDGQIDREILIGRNDEMKVDGENTEAGKIVLAENIETEGIGIEIEIATEQTAIQDEKDSVLPTIQIAATDDGTIPQIQEINVCIFLNQTCITVLTKFSPITPIY